MILNRNSRVFFNVLKREWDWMLDEVGEEE